MYYIKNSGTESESNLWKYIYMERQTDRQTMRLRERMDMKVEPGFPLQ